MLMMSRAPRHDDQLTLTAEEVAYLVGVKTGKTILRWTQQNSFPRPMHSGGYTRWSRSDVELWAKFGGDMEAFYAARD